MSEDSGHRARNDNSQNSSMSATLQPTSNSSATEKQQTNRTSDNSHIKSLSRSTSATGTTEKSSKSYKLAHASSDSDEAEEAPQIISRNRYSATAVQKNSKKQEQQTTTPTSKRNRSVNPHPKRAASNSDLRKEEQNDATNNDAQQTSSRKTSQNSDSTRNTNNAGSNKSKRADSVRRHPFKSDSDSPDNQRVSNNSKSKQKSLAQSGNRLKCVNPIIIEHYFVEERPQPFSGVLVSKINGRSMISALKQDEALQFVTQIIPGPTLRSTNKNTTSTASMTSTTTSTTGTSLKSASQQTFIPQEKQRARSVSQKSDVLISNLFVDDDPITYFNFDFATSYTSEHDEVIDESSAQNYFPSIEQIESHKINFNEDSTTVISNLKAFFHAESQPQEYLSLTKTVSPYKNDVIMSSTKRVRQIDTISSTSFFEFRFGSDVTEFAPDRIHLFTWHNLGIPASQIAKNLLYFFGSLRDAANIKTPVKAISQYVLMWIRYFPKDFDEESACADLILQLLKNMAGKSKASICFINVVGSLVVDLHNKTIKPEDIYIPLHTPVFKEIARVNYLINLSLDPYILAQHFAYIDLCMLHQLQRTEFVHNNWQERKNLSPFFHQVMSRFNETVAFIAASILIDAEKRRARNISYWIKMMYYARRVHNYHLLAIIDAGLSCFPVKRLKNSWKMVNDNALIAFSRLHNFFKKQENQREMLSEPKKTIPFIGIFLSQLSQIDLDSTKTTLKSGASAYNLTIQRKCFNIVDQVFYPWGTELEFELDEKLLKECKLLSGKARQPKDLIIPSISFEPVRNDEKEVLAEYLTRT